MLCLGIEGTAHTLGIGVVDERCRVLANVSAMYSPPKGGIHPREAADMFAESFPQVLNQGIEKAGITLKDIGAVAFSRGPGLGPCLRIVATGARALALSLGADLIGVNHCIAHLEIGRKLCRCDDPTLLYVSGGNTQVIGYKMGRYRVLGETIDIGLGNMIDKLGRELGMKFPCGPEIERIASRGKEYIELPYSVKGMDVSFSGIATAALALSKKHKIEDVLYSVQETCFGMVCEVAERAMAHTGSKELLLGGGVAQNKRFREMASIMARERGAKSYVPPNEFLRDNGAMIAWTGLLMHKHGVRTSLENSAVDQRWRTDEVEVVWR